jgi:hypothetical protein
LSLAEADPLKAAHALGICDGLVSAAWVYPDGSADTTGGGGFNLGHGLTGIFGVNNTVHEGQAMVVLSSGTARTPAQASYAAELDKGYAIAIPAGFPMRLWAASPPTATVMTGLPCGSYSRCRRVRSFAFDYAYFSHDYPDGGCTAFIDQAAALITGLTGISGVHNALLDPAGNPMFVSTSSMRQCVNGTHNGQAYNTCESTSALVGTGFDNNGASGWLRTADLPVVSRWHGSILSWCDTRLMDAWMLRGKLLSTTPAWSQALMAGPVLTRAPLGPGQQDHGNIQHGQDY